MSFFRRKTASDKPKSNLPSNISDDPGAPDPGEEVAVASTQPATSSNATPKSKKLLTMAGAGPSKLKLSSAENAATKSLKSVAPTSSKSYVVQKKPKEDKVEVVIKVEEVAEEDEKEENFQDEEVAVLKTRVPPTSQKKKKKRDASRKVYPTDGVGAVADTSVVVVDNITDEVSSSGPKTISHSSVLILALFCGIFSGIICGYVGAKMLFPKQLQVAGSKSGALVANNTDSSASVSANTTATATTKTAAISSSTISATSAASSLSIYPSLNSVISYGKGGTDGGYLDGPVSQARFDSPQSVAVLPNGDIVIADTGNGAIRYISSTGQVSSLTSPANPSKRSLASSHILLDPKYVSLSFDSSLLYVSDHGDNTIKKVDLLNGKVQLLAGSGHPGYSDNGFSISSFYHPSKVFVYSNTFLLLADSGNDVIRGLNLTSSATATVSGNGNTSFTSVDGPSLLATYKSPHSIAYRMGFFYISDTNSHKIRRLGISGSSLDLVSTFAGSGDIAMHDGWGKNASFNYPMGIAFDINHNLYVADSGNNVIRKITSQGYVSTVAGNGTRGYSDSVALHSMFNRPTDVFMTPVGNLLIVDSGNNVIRLVGMVVPPDSASTISTNQASAIVSSSPVTTPITSSVSSFINTPAVPTWNVVGSGYAAFSDGEDLAASFNNPSGVAIDSDGNVYVADETNHKIRKISPSGSVATLAGSGNAGFADGMGSLASFNYPNGAAVDNNGIIYVADSANNRIRKISPSGTVSTLAGSGNTGCSNGEGMAASFNYPMGVTVDYNGTIYIADFGNNNIRKISPSGAVSTLAGSGNPGFSDGWPSLFYLPAGVAVDSNGVVYVADTYNRRIRKISPSGAVSTLAGSGNAGYSDGEGLAASFNYPMGVAVDYNGTVYVADSANNRIRKISPSGTVSTLAGSVNNGNSDGEGMPASFDHPTGVAVNSYGDVIVADETNQRIRKISSTSTSISSFSISIFSSAYSFSTALSFSVPSLPLQTPTYGYPFIVPLSAPTPSIDSTTTAPTWNVVGSGIAAFSDGDGSEASFNNPTGIAVDSNGAVYVTDQDNHRIRRIGPSGSVTTLAGSGLSAFADGVGAAASFYWPVGIAVDSNGTVYTADFANNRIRKISPLGAVSTLAGSGNTAFSDGEGVEASFYYPNGVAVDTEGNVYVADLVNNRIRMISASGNVSTFAGSGNAAFSDGEGLEASFFYPNGVAVDSDGTVYVADSANNRIRKISPSATVSTLAGSGIAAFADGEGLAASFNYPTGVAVDYNGTVFVADQYNHRIRMISASGNVTTFAGSGSARFGDGVGLEASFSYPSGVSVDSNGAVYITDSGNNRIRKFTYGSSTITSSSIIFSSAPTDSSTSFYASSSTWISAPTSSPILQAAQGVVSTLAGSGSSAFADGDGVVASFYDPKGVAVDSDGSIFVADSSNHRIRKISPPGAVSTLAGSGSPAFTDGVSVAASFYDPKGIAIDTNGSIFVADTQNHRIRKISPSGNVTTLAGSGSPAFADGDGVVASFNYPVGVAVASNGTVYVADQYNHRIRKITSSGNVTTIAGSGSPAFLDGDGVAASFYYPAGVAVDCNGTVFVADFFNHRIRLISPLGSVTTVAGSGIGQFADGVGLEASFHLPAGIAVDYNGTVFVADFFNHRIRLISPLGSVTTLAGSGNAGYSDGEGLAASFNYPMGVAVDYNGTVYVADSQNNRIRKIVFNIS